MHNNVPYFAAFKRAVVSRGSEPFLTIYGQSGERPIEYSFHFFWGECVSFARRLLSLGLRPNDIVLIFAGTQIDTYLAFFGAQMAGGVPSIMPPPTPKQDMAHYKQSHLELIRRIEPRLLCGPRGVLAALEADSTEIRQVAFEDLSSNLVWNDPSPGLVTDLPLNIGCDLALLQHSSGTTGLKKGVMLSYEAISNQVRHYADSLKLADNDRIVSWLPLYHDMGLIACTVIPFVTATPVIVIDPFVWLADPLLLMQAVDRHYCTLTWLPNFAFEHLANAGRRQWNVQVDASSLRMVINCSEVCRPSSMSRFQKTFASYGLSEKALHTCYALAENVFAATQSPPVSGSVRILVDAAALDRNEIVVVDRAAGSDHAVRELVSSGPPLDGCTLMVRTEIGRTSDERRIGEVILQSDSMLDGYYRNAALSEERLVGGWFATRDLGFLHGGHVYVLGRLDDVIIYRGRNIFAGDLEAALLGIPGLKPGRTVAFGVYAEGIGSEQVIVLSETAEKNPGRDVLEGIEDMIRSRLQDQFGINPTQVVPMAPNSLRKTTSGKVSRVQNKQQFLRAAQLEQIKL